MDLATYFDKAVPFMLGRTPAQTLTDDEKAAWYPRVVRGTALDALASLYPLTRQALDEADAEGGEPAATCRGRGHTLLSAFLDETPPRERDIARLGVGLGAFLEAQGLSSAYAELADLEEAERAAATAPIDFRPDEDSVNPTLEVRQYRHPVVAWARAQRLGRVRPRLEASALGTFAFVRSPVDGKVRTVPLAGLGLLALALAAGEVAQDALGALDEAGLAAARDTLRAAFVLGRQPS